MSKAPALCQILNAKCIFNELYMSLIQENHSKVGEILTEQIVENLNGFLLNIQRAKRGFYQRILECAADREFAAVARRLQEGNNR